MITEILTTDKENEASIRLIINSSDCFVQIDNHITPLYCCNCERQLDNLFKLDGGRYGQVGVVNCRCGAAIHCIDSDNIVEYLDTITRFEDKTIGRYFIDFRQLYRLNDSIWLMVKEKFGYDIFKQHENQTIQLLDVLNDLRFKFNLTIDSSKQYSTDKFHQLPIIVNQWFGLLSLEDK